MIYYTKFNSNIFTILALFTDCIFFNNLLENDQKPVVVDDIHGAEVFSNQICIEEAPIGMYTGYGGLRCSERFHMVIHDNQDGGNLNTRVLRKWKQIGYELDKND